MRSVQTKCLSTAFRVIFYGQFIKFLQILKSQIKSNFAQWSSLLTIKSREVGLLVAEVHGAADGVDAAVMLG